MRVSGVFCCERGECLAGNNVPGHEDRQAHRDAQRRGVSKVAVGHREGDRQVDQHQQGQANQTHVLEAKGGHVRTPNDL